MCVECTSWPNTAVKVSKQIPMFQIDCIIFMKPCLSVYFDTYKIYVENKIYIHIYAIRGLRLPLMSEKNVCM